MNRILLISASGSESLSELMLALSLGAATDPIEPIHDYTVPIPPFKHPPLREDYPPPRKRDRKPVPKESPEHRDDGHIDEYA